MQAHLGQASGTAERGAAVDMLDSQPPGSTRRITLGADRGYDAASFVGDLRRMEVTAHIARNDAVVKIGKRRRSVIDGRTTRHAGRRLSQRVRTRIEETIGWAKTIVGLAKTKLRGTRRVAYQSTFTMHAYPHSSGSIRRYMSTTKELSHDARDARRSVA